MSLNYDGGMYNSPPGNKSTIDGAGSNQMHNHFWWKTAIIDARKETFFGNLSSTKDMPKHFGKTMKVYHYIPLLDDRNINDQGIDAAGAVIAYTWTAFDAVDKVVGTGYASEAAALAAPGAVRAERGNGNLYGSSKDIGTITGKLPLLSETGGRVNRVGFTRLTREGSIHSMGFFHEFTQESLDFDSDAELKTHLARELMNGAVQLTEAVLQKDLLAAATTIIYAGEATSDDEVTGEGANPSTLSYRTLMRLDKELTDNRTPKQTKVITGSRLVDTRVIPSARIAFVGSDLVPHLKGMVDLFGNKAFIETQHYGDAGTILNGEIGTIDSFRIIQVPEMLYWAGAGAEATAANPGYQTTMVGGDERYDVHPFFVVGDESFVNIGFQTDGKRLKFKVITKMPGEETATAAHDPYGRTGFSSIQWYHGILVMRPERLGLLKCVAPI